MYKIKQQKTKKFKNCIKNTAFKLCYNTNEGHMKNPVKHPRPRFLQKQIMAFSCKIFLEKAPSQMPEWFRNTPLQPRDHNAWEKPMANSVTISKLTAINLARKRTSSSLRKILCALRYILKSNQTILSCFLDFKNYF